MYAALEEKGYNPYNQIVGYLISGDPAYIPRNLDARNLIRRHERDEIIEELVRFYLDNHPTETKKKVKNEINGFRCWFKNRRGCCQ